MNWVGGLLLFSGWSIAIAAVLLFPGLGERALFIVTGIFVELLGLGLWGRGFIIGQRRNSQGAP